MNKQRNISVQIIRGICICAVVLIHCKSGIDYPKGSFWYSTGLILRQLINFPGVACVFLSWNLCKKV